MVLRRKNKDIVNSLKAEVSLMSPFTDMEGSFAGPRESIPSLLGGPDETNFHNIVSGPCIASSLKVVWPKTDQSDHLLWSCNSHTINFSLDQLQ